MNLSGKNVIITGGSSGIGKATALACAKLGARVAIVAHTQAKIIETVSELSSFGGLAKGYLCDISNKALVEKTFQEIFKDFGSVDVLVNNAGYATYQTFHDASLDEIEHLTLVNYMGAIYCSKLSLDKMAAQKSGHIVNVASVAGAFPITPNATYGAAKHGIIALTENLRCEYARFNIKFSLNLPGRVDTHFFDHVSFKKRSKRPEHAGMLSADYIAKQIVNQITRESESR